MCAPPADVDSFAIQAQAYLQLAAGTNKFHVQSDDCVGIYSGTSVNDTSITLFESPPNNTQDTDFVVVAEAAGLYPVNIIWQQGKGGAVLALSTVDSGSNRHLVNDLANGGIPAFYPPPSWTCMSSSSVKGPYNTPVVTTMLTNNPAVTTVGVPCGGNGANPVLNVAITGWGLSTNTFTVTPGSSPTFYRLLGPGSSKILSYKKSGSNLSVTYQCQVP
jgi:hypothetical protein